MRLVEMQRGGRFRPAPPMWKESIGILAFSILVLVAAIGVGAEDSPQYTKVTEEEAESLLESFSSQLISNFDRIETWKGTCEYEDTHIYSGLRAVKNAPFLGLDEADSISRVVKRVTGSGEFAVRPGTDELFTTHIGNSTLIDVSRGSGAAEQLERPNFMQRSVVTPEHYLHFQPNARYGESKTLRSDGAVGRSAFRDPVAKAEDQQWGIVVDPSEFFGDSAPYWETMAAFAETLRKGIRIEGHESIDVVQVFRSSVAGTTKYRILYTAPTGGESLVRYEMTLDSAAGFNVTRLVCALADGTPMQTSTWEYEEKDGVLLPSKINRVIYDRETGEARFERTVTLTESILNGPLSDDTFTWKSLGLEDGDRLIDNLENKEFTLRSGSLEEATGANPEISNALDLSEIAEELPEPVEAHPSVSEQSSPADEQAQVPAEEHERHVDLWKAAFFVGLTCVVILVVLVVMKYCRLRGKRSA